MTLNWESFSFDNYSQLETIPKWEWFSIAARSQLKKIKKVLTNGLAERWRPAIWEEKSSINFRHESTRLSKLSEYSRNSTYPQLWEWFSTENNSQLKMILNYELLSTENDSQVGMNCQKIQNIKTLKKLLTF